MNCILMHERSMGVLKWHALETSTNVSTAEAPFFPGAIFLMSSWYTRPELALRIAWFYCGHSVANAFGGLLGAGVLGNLNGARGVAGW